MGKCIKPTQDMPWYDLDQILMLIPISRATLYAWIKTGQFPSPLKMGGGRKIFWRKTVVNAWLDAQS